MTTTNSRLTYARSPSGFLAPWVLGFSGIAAMAWSAWIIGVLAVIRAGSTLLAGGNLTGRSSAAAR